MYFISFVDEFTRKIWVFVIGSKSDSFVLFQKRKKQVEKESNRYIKFLRIEPLINLRTFVVKKALYMRLLLHTPLNIMGF